MRDKWKDYRLLKREKALQINLPETKLLTKKSLWEMMKKYNQVIIKPRNGSQGRGITQISSLGNNLFEIHAENKKVTLTGRENVYYQLKISKKALRNKRYIVQQRVPLATINDCPFDLRVMVQRKKILNVGSNRKTSKSGSYKLFHYECSLECIAGGRSGAKF